MDNNRDSKTGRFIKGNGAAVGHGRPRKKAADDFALQFGAIMLETEENEVHAVCYYRGGITRELLVKYFGEKRAAEIVAIANDNEYIQSLLNRRSSYSDPIVFDDDEGDDD